MIIKKRDTKQVVSAADNEARKQTLSHIKAAIDILGSVVDKDAKAKDAIANLGVIYFDLK